MINVDGVSNGNWDSCNVPPRTLDAARTTESGSGGKLDRGIHAAAPARMKPLADRQIRSRTPIKEIAERFIQ